MGEVTQCLADLRGGDATARTRLVELVYAQLRTLAGGYLRKQPRSHTLQPTALVHEAFLRMVGDDNVTWNDRAHFFAACGGVMRNILADYARRRRAAKRGGAARQVTLLNTLAASADEPIDIVALDDALTSLAALNQRHARVVECRFFAGMSVPEVAEALGVAPRTIDNDWAMARAWLGARLSGERAE
jgi:RNA polymerase sigma factor (TIGR02999 family)